MSDIVLSPDEIVKLTGYKRPADQLRELHALGFYRARLGKVTRSVILERAHHDAVATGKNSANQDKYRPQLRLRK